MALDTEFKADRLNVNHLKLNGIDISNFYIETLGDGKLIDSMRGDMMVQITPSMLDANGEYKIEQLPGLGRFTEVEIDPSSLPSQLYYISPTGLDSNLGTKDSPFKTQSNVPANSYVILLNGTYDKYITIDSYQSVLECLYSIKNGTIIIGESKTGVILKRRNNGSGGRDWPIISNVATCTLYNVTVDYYIGSNMETYQVSFARYPSNVYFDNIKFNIQGDYSLCYNNDDGKAYYNNCTFTGGNLKPNYSGSSYYTSNTNTYILYDISNKCTLNSNPLVMYNMLDLKTNTLIFKTTQTSFSNTIKLNLWIEQ